MILRIPVHAVQRFLTSFRRRQSGSPRENVSRRWIDPDARQPLQVKIISQARAALVLRACICIRLKDLDAAQAILYGTGLDEADPARLNLLGIICELRKQWRRARRLYGQAIRGDRAYEPARQNLRRLYELYTFGASRGAVNLGDEDPQLWAKRAHFLQRLETDHRHRPQAVHYHDN